jgi:hypothetical protein
MGRKVVGDQGKAFKLFHQEVSVDIAAAEPSDPRAQALNVALTQLSQATDFVIQQSSLDANAIGAASCDYLNLFGLTAYAHMWLKMAQVAKQGEGDFYRAKLATADFFFQRLLPESGAYLAKVLAGSDTLMALDADLM